MRKAYINNEKYNMSYTFLFTWCLVNEFNFEYIILFPKNGPISISTTQQVYNIQKCIIIMLFSPSPRLSETKMTNLKYFCI